MEYIVRSITENLKNMLKQFKVILLTGPRQAGKSTLLKNIFGDEYTYISLDEINAFSLAKNEPELFFKSNPGKLIIDEVQYAPELFRTIKYIADNSEESGQFILTGSQKYSLMKNISESLAGRICILELQGLSMREKKHITFSKEFLPSEEYCNERKKQIKRYENLWEEIHRGSMPRLADKTMEWDAFYNSYESSYIERDVKQIVNVRDATLFHKFMITLASHTGELFNATSIASDLGVNIKTIQDWTSILEASGIIFFLKPYENNVYKRTIKTPKLYFLDTGLVCHLVGWETAKVAENGAMSGALFETFVISEIFKSYINIGKSTKNLYYYRDKDKKEIDLLIVKNNSFYPVEIKKTARPVLSMAKNFDVLNKFSEMTVEHGAIVCQCDKSFYLSEKISALPVEFI